MELEEVFRFFLLMILIGFLSGFTWGVSRKVEEGNRLWKEGNYEEALRHYSEAQMERPQAPEIPYNMGNSFYRQKRYKEALEAHTKSMQLDGGPLREKIVYNMGNSLVRQENLQEALSAYKKALDADPSDVDAKYNIEFIQRKLKEKQEQKQKQKPQQPQNKQEQRQGEQQQQGASGQGEQKKEGKAEGSSQETQKSPEETGKEREKTEPQPQDMFSPGGMSKKDAERLLGARQGEERRLPVTLENRQNRPLEIEVDKDW